MIPWPSWLRRGANNAKISSSILLGIIYIYIFFVDGDRKIATIENREGRGYFLGYVWARGVVGSAPALQAGGLGFDSQRVHIVIIFWPLQPYAISKMYLKQKRVMSHTSARAPAKTHISQKRRL